MAPLSSKPREFLFPKWSETVKLLSYLSSLWVALAEQIVSLLLLQKYIIVLDNSIYDCVCEGAF